MARRPFTFTEFDGRISHILGKLECDGKNEVVEELATDVEVDVLQDLRERVFVLAKDSYETALKESETIDKNETVDITLIRRTKAGDSSALSKDVVDLYSYAVGWVEEFPRDVLTRGSKLKEVKKKEANDKRDQATEWQEVFNKQNKEVVHQRIFNAEIMNRMRDMEKRMESLADSCTKDRQVIEKMQSDLDAANHEIARLKSVTNMPEENPSDRTTLENNIASGQEGNTTEEQQVDEQHQAPSIENKSEFPALPPPASKDAPGTSASAAPKTKPNWPKNVLPPPKSQPMVTRMTDTEGNFTTYLHKKGTAESQPLEQYRRDQHDSRQSEHPAHGNTHRTSNQRRQLRGARKERGISMYLSGIEIDNETNE